MITTFRRFVLKIPNFGRQISDEGWEVIEVQAIKQISELQNIYNEQVHLNDGRSYQFNFDLSPCVMSHSDRVRRHTEFSKTGDFSVWSYVHHHADCFIEAKTIGEDVPNPARNVASILQYVLCEMFLTMCIVNPGVFNLDRAELVDVPERRAVGGHPISYDVELSGHLPENFHYSSARLKWLPEQSVTIRETVSWLIESCPRFGMVADNPTNRCLLALLAMCKGAPYSSANAAWIFNALESLFSCQPGENKAALVRRISILLSLNEKKSKELKKSITELYNLRSAFVHGGVMTMHPVQDDALDARVTNEYIKLMRAVDDGVTIIIAVLRALILAGVSWPVFEEKLVARTDV